MAGGSQAMNIMKFPILQNPAFGAGITHLTGREKNIWLGPSAHSFDGESRQWNISNNNVLY